MSFIYRQLLLSMDEIAMNEMLPEYTRNFASLFRSIFHIHINAYNDKTTYIFEEVCDTILMTYLHRMCQVIDNTIDPKESVADYDKLNEMVESIYHQIKTKENPERTRRQIEYQMSLSF